MKDIPSTKSEESLQVEFWFEFGSTYSYLSAMRIEALSVKSGREIRWVPFLLGPVFKQSGWDDSPFNIYSAKGSYMWRDMERRCAKYDIPFQRLPSEGPTRFPQNGLLATRVAQLALERPWGKEFCRNIFHAQFARGLDISDVATVSNAIKDSGGDSELIEEAETDANKTRLRKTVDEALALGIFGAPFFKIDSELFWGDDRLEDALEHVALTY